MAVSVWLLACAGALPGRARPVVVKVPITESDERKMEAFLAGRSPLDVDSYASSQLDSIGPLENVLFRKALLLGGLDAVFEDVIVPNSARARISLKTGHTLAGGVAQWHYYFHEMEGQVLESSVVIPSGWYEKGLYTTLKKQSQYHIASLADLKRLTAVTSESWAVDWHTLGQLGLAGLYSAPTRPMQFAMVDGGRADFTLQDFSAVPDLSIEEGGVRLYPIPSVKMVLKGTRHFLVNKNQPNSRAVFDAVQRGLKLLHQQGEIKRSLVESGIMNKAVRNWTLLNPDRAPARGFHPSLDGDSGRLSGNAL
jgi:hypothetical protein